VELLEGYDPSDIDVSTVLLNEVVPAEAEPTEVGDYDSDGVMDRMMKFPRLEVIDMLPSGEQVEVWVSGEVAGDPFEGADTIRVLMPRVTYPNGGEVFESGQECTITWEVPAGYAPDWHDVYYTADDGETWEAIAGIVEGAYCTWIVPELSSASCRILIEAYDAEGAMGYDTSDKSFSVCSSAGVDKGDVIPTRFALHRAEPNPFAGATRIRFDLPEACHTRVTIHDVRGKLVASLSDGMYRAGSHSVAWDGKNTGNRQVPAGVYFVRFAAGQYSATEKAVFAR
jgi:hypothetical protein